MQATPPRDPAATPPAAPRAARFGQRLRRQPAAMIALGAFLVMALACLLGPFLSPHPPERIYPDLVRTPPGLAGHPRPEAVPAILERLALRMRVEVEAVSVGAQTIQATFRADRPIDPRVLTYLPRSDLFGPAQVTARDEDGRRIVVHLAIRHLVFPLGTDGLGRDVLVRSIVAGRVSLLVGAAATLVALVVGVAYGAIAGMAGGRVDAVMMRLVDVIYALPFVFFVIVLLVFFRAGLALVLVAVSAVEWLDMARIVRAQTLSLRSRDFVRAAEALGLTRRAVALRHILPNTLGPITVAATLLVPRVILLESFLSFLGLGVQEPATSWGVLIAEGARSIESLPWVLAAPAFCLVVTLLALNVFGDALADTLSEAPRARP